MRINEIKHNKNMILIQTYANAVQFSRCCILDHKILLVALGMIHAKATQAPNRLNCKSVTVATATPTDTTVSATTCKKNNISHKVSYYTKVCLFAPNESLQIQLIKIFTSDD